MEGKQIAKEIPPLKDLINITSTLAIGRPIDDQNLRKIAEQAMKLWAACSDERNQTIEFVSLRTEALETDLARQNEIPNPKKFPVTFDQRLKLWICGRNKNYRIGIYREYVKEMIWKGHISEIKYPKNLQSAKVRFARAVMSYEDAAKLAKPISSSELNAAMKEDADRTIEKEGLYRIEARALLDWFKEYKASVRRRRARSGAEASILKRRKNG
jgi:hypothetical protein